MVGSARIRFEATFDRTRAEIWPVLSDSNRRNAVAGMSESYTVEDAAQADGSVRRHARGRMGPFRVEWQEGFGEWVENRRKATAGGYLADVRRSLQSSRRRLPARLTDPPNVPANLRPDGKRIGVAHHIVKNIAVIIEDAFRCAGRAGGVVNINRSVRFRR